MSKTKHLLSFALLSTTSVLAQNPREIRLDNDPFDFTDPVKLITVVIIPGLLILVGLMIIRNRKKRKKEKEK
jgi:hypothetical protein